MSYDTQSTSPGTGHARGTFESTLRRMWETRPVRFPRSQSTRSWFFGVCEGIAVRYQVSPMLVRLMFVLMTFVGGVGLWVYGLALLVFRRYTVPKTPLEVLVRGERDPRYGEDRSLAIGTLIVGAVFLVFGGIFSGGITLTGLVVSTALTGVMWWLLHERQPVPPTGLLDRNDVGDGVRDDVPSTQAAAAPAAPTIDLGDMDAAQGFEPPRRQPPSWDPLGTAPFAWDLPDPGVPDDGQGTGAGQDGRRKKRRGLKALVVAAVLAVVLAMIAGVIAVAAVFFPSWGGINSTDGDTTSGTFTGGTEQVGELGSYRHYTYTMSSPNLDFSGTTLTQDSVIDLNTTMASVGLTFPETTDGASYRVHLNCESTTMSDVDCDSFDDTLVQGSGDRGDRGETEHTLTVNVTATMSEVRFDQI